MTENKNVVVKKTTLALVFCRGDHRLPAFLFATTLGCYNALFPHQHLGVIPSVVEESRGNEFFLLSRDRVFINVKYSSARANTED